MRTPLRASWHLRLTTGCLLLVLGGQLGCEPAMPVAGTGRPAGKSPAQPAPKPEPPPEQQPAPAIDVAAGVQPWITKSELPWEVWYLQYLNGNRVGYSHILINGSPLENNQDLLHIRRTDCVEVLHEGSTTLFQRQLEAKEYTNGRLIRLNDASITADSELQTDGTLAGETFTATTIGGKEPANHSVAWKSGTWGVMGLQAILRRQPPQAGQRLTAKVFVPQLYKIADVEIQAGQPEPTTLPGEASQLLLPLDVVLWTEDNGLRSRNWINDQGEILKTVSLSGPSMITFRVPEAVAHRVRDEFDLQPLLGSRIPLGGQQAAAGAASMRYLVERDSKVSDVDLFAWLAKTPQQQVRSLSALSAEADVVRLQPEQLSTAPETAEPAPGDACRSPSALIPSDKPQIKQFADELLTAIPATAAAAADTNTLQLAPSAAAPAAEQPPPWQLALQLVQGLHAAVATGPMDRVVADPLQTLRQRTGDSVDQALLLTALLRSQQIPARVASGLALDVDQPDSLQFAMWTEAWLNDRWVPLDPTTGQIAAADRLKILDSPLDGSNPYDAILPVVREMKGLQVRVLNPK